MKQYLNGWLTEHLKRQYSNKTLYRLLMFTVMFSLLLLIAIPLYPFNWASIAPLFVYTLLLLAFWPGILTPDSIAQWEQIITGRLLNDHPLFHTFLIWLLTRISPTPGVVSVFQVIAMSFSVGYILNKLQYYLSLNRFVVLLISILIAISLPNGLLSITIWKDVPFSICFLWFYYFWFRAINTDGNWLKDTKHVAALLTSNVLLILLRHNGILIVIPSMLYLLFINTAIHKRIIVMLVVLSSVYYFTNVIALDLLNIKKVNVNLLFFELHQIAAHLASDSALSSTNAELLNAIRPTYDDWDYDCMNLSSTVHNNKLNFSKAVENKDEILETLIGMVISDPGTTVNHFFCSSQLIWSINRPNDRLVTSGVYRNEDNKVVTISPNSYGLRNIVLVPALTEFMVHRIFLASWYDPNITKFIWRPAIYLYLLVFASVVYSFRGQKMKSLRLLIPIFVSALTLALVVPNQTFRYMYPLYLTSIVFSIPLLIAKKTW